LRIDEFWLSTRRRFDGATLLAVDWLEARRVRPNAITWLSLAPAFASLIAAAGGYFVWAAVSMALGGLCDFIDGPLARRHGHASRFGALLDSTLDRFADAAPLLGLVYFYASYPAAALAVACSAFAGFSVSYVRARAEGLAIALPWLWMRRTERLLLTGVGLLLAPVPFPAIAAPAPVTLVLTSGVGLLSLVAAMHAIFVAEQLSEGDAKSGGQ
jgi:CDP-diacylglycerol--glycerol-3-phosphate 3-phosphatidyltransferase